jgi:hypothetical protein
MADLEGKYYQVPWDGAGVQPITSARWVKVGIALISGFCLGLLSVSAPTLRSTGAAESTDLFAFPRLQLPRKGLIYAPRSPAIPRAFPSLGFASAQRSALTRLPVSVAAGGDLASQGLRADSWKAGDLPQVADAAKFVGNALQNKGMVVFSKTY